LGPPTAAPGAPPVWPGNGRAGPSPSPPRASPGPATAPPPPRPLPPPAPPRWVSSSCRVVRLTTHQPLPIIGPQDPTEPDDGGACRRERSLCAEPPAVSCACGDGAVDLLEPPTTTTAPLETVPLADLRPHPRNYRSPPPEQIAHLAESIR